MDRGKLGTVHHEDRATISPILKNIRALRVGQHFKQLIDERWKQHRVVIVVSLPLQARLILLIRHCFDQLVNKNMV
jgi:hypothetical protein